MAHRPEIAAESVSIVLACLSWLGLAVDRRAVAGDRPAGPPHKTRSAVMARQGMAATSQPLATATAIRVLQTRGQRHRCRDRGQRRTGGGRADVVRDRRRSVRDRLGRQDQAALRLERQRPCAGRGHDRSFQSQGAGRDPDARAALSWSVPGCVDGWDQLREAFRHEGLARAARAGDRLRRDRLSGQ